MGLRAAGDARGARPATPGQPVMVAGDPERAHKARREVEGIPVAKGLLAQLKEIAETTGAPWLLG